MFANEQDVKLLTNKTVFTDVILRAQSILEIFVGKMENEITNSKDFELLKRATAYQVTYMLENEEIIFEQIKASTIMQNDSSTTFKSGDEYSPWIAPLALIACSQLSFFSSRSIKTGKINPFSKTEKYWVFE